jgi:hypothetical protein
MSKKKQAVVPQEPIESETTEPTVAENEPVETDATTPEPTVAEVAQVEAVAEVVEPTEVRAEEVKPFMIGNDGNPIIPAALADNKIVRTEVDYAWNNGEKPE